MAANYSDLLSLSRLVADCCRSPSKSRLRAAPSSCPGIEDANGPCLLVSVAPMAASFQYGLGTQHCAAVMIREVGVGTSTGIPSNALVMALFDLSPAEARLALRLATGLSLAEAAQDCGLSIASARTYFSRVFLKMGTHSQHQLVALLHSAGSLGAASDTSDLPEAASTNSCQPARPRNPTGIYSVPLSNRDRQTIRIMLLIGNIQLCWKEPARARPQLGAAMGHYAEQG